MNENPSAPQKSNENSTSAELFSPDAPFCTPHFLTKNAINELAKEKCSVYLLIFTLIFSFVYRRLIICRSFTGYAVPLCVGLFYLIAVFFLRGRENSFSKDSVAMLLPISLLSLTFLFDSGGMTRFITALTMLGCILIQTTAMSGFGKSGVFSPGIIKESLSAAFAHTFSNFGAALKILSQGIFKGTKSRGALKVFYGLLFSVPFLLIFGLAFANTNYIFESIVNSIPMNLINLKNNISGFINYLFIVMILTSFFMVLRAGTADEKKPYAAKKGLDCIAVNTFLCAVILIQALFISLQFYLIFSGNILPDGYTYAQYARKGFFDLVSASLLTAGIVFFISFFGKKDENGNLPKSTKVLLTLLSVFNFALFYFAFSRLFTYIKFYDLSVSRITACWFMALNALLILGIIIKIHCKSFPFFKWAVIALCGTVLVLNVVNPDRLTARYNVDRYLSSPETVELDLYYLESLSPCAALELDRLKGTALEEDARITLYHIFRDFKTSARNAALTDRRILNVFEEWENDEWRFAEEAYNH